MNDALSTTPTPTAALFHTLLTTYRASRQAAIAARFAQVGDSYLLPGQLQLQHTAEERELGALRAECASWEARWAVATDDDVLPAVTSSSR